MVIGGYHTPSNDGSGHVHIYTLTENNWTLVADLVGYQYGAAVAMNDAGDRVVIKALNAVEIYHRNPDGTWDRIGQTIALTEIQSVAISGDGAWVGIGNPGFGSTGVVYIYTQEGDDTWVLKDTIYGSEHLGYAIDLDFDGTRLVVSDDELNIATGEVRVYGRSGAIWTQVGDTLNGGGGGDVFGKQVQVNSAGNRIAVGIPGASSTGAVEVYDDVEGTWTKVGDTIFGTVADSDFGTAVGMSADGSMVVVGAPYQNSGQVIAFVLIGTNWTKINGPIDGDSTGDRFGWSVAMSGDGSKMIIGATLGANGYAKSFAVENWMQLYLT